ncbi:hypothetical protein EDB89DRAFT_1911645 [Lactarius sanguifluus]|nr:hypothetical protein EDB89DRAFT_1911645 [Lactarius sanguifluus]
MPDTVNDVDAYLPDGSMQAAFDSALTGFFIIGNTWARCPHQAPQIASWLRLFQGSWDYLRLLADIANDGDMGSDAYALRSLVKTEAARFADVDWLNKFLMITNHVQSRVLLYTGVLCRLKFGMQADIHRTQTATLEQCLAGSLVRAQVPDIYDRAAIEFDELWSAGEISREDYYWFLSKLRDERLAVVAKWGPLPKKVVLLPLPRSMLASPSKVFAAHGRPMQTHVDVVVNPMLLYV